MEYDIYYIFQKVFRKIPCYTKLRIFEKLIPVLMHFFLKEQNYRVDKQHIVEHSILSRREFEEIMFKLMDGTVM